jgi:hypothetical protein
VLEVVEQPPGLADLDRLVEATARLLRLAHVVQDPAESIETRDAPGMIRAEAVGHDAEPRLALLPRRGKIPQLSQQ